MFDASIQFKNIFSGRIKMINDRRGNKNKLIAVSILAMLITLDGCNKEDDAKEHLQKGVEYLNKGDYEKARLELKTSNQADKDTAETYYYLALLDEKNRNYKTMKENLQKTIELAPNHSEARVKLGNLLVLTGDIDSANEQAEFILKNSSQDVDGRELKASVLIRQQKQQEALEIIENLLKENPANADALSLKSIIYMQKNDINTALSLIDAAIKSDPKNISLHLFRIQLHANEKNESAIINDYQTLIAQYPDNRDIKVMLVKEYARVGKDKESEELLRSIISHAPDDIGLKLLLLDFLESRVAPKAEENVLKQFHQFTEQHKDQPRILLELSNWMIKRKNFDEANLALNRILELENSSNLAFAAKTLMARNALDNNDIDRAAKFIEEVLVDNPNYDDAKIVQARLLLAKKQYDEAVGLLNKVDWSKPNSDEVQFLLGQSFLDKGDEIKAQKYFSKALELNPANLDAFAYVYNKVLAANDTKYAEELLKKTLKFVPSNLLLLQQLAKINLSKQDWSGAQTVSQAIANVANPLAKDLAKYLQAQIFQAQENYSKAIEIYKELLVKFPENGDALTGLAACYESLNKRDEMLVFLNNSLAKNPKNVSANVLLANLYFMDKKFDKGVPILSDLIKSNPGYTQLYALLAKAKLAQNDVNGAISTLQEGIKQNPRDIQLPLSLATVYEGRSDFDSAVSIYEKLLVNNAKLDVAINNLASLLTDHYSDKEKIDRAVKLAEKFKDSTQPNLRDTYAWALIKQGDIGKGLELLKQIVAEAPDEPIFKYHLGSALYKNGDIIPAISELKQSIEQAKLKKLSAEQKNAEILLKEISDKNPSH